MENRLLLAAVILVPALIVGWISSAGSMPILMDRYNEHPQSVARHRDDCVICHVQADGSGPLSPFGERYDRVGLEFAPELIEEYPNLFQVAGGGMAGAEAAVGSMGAGAVPVPGNEPFDVRTYYLQECKKCHGQYGEGDPFQGVPAFATRKWLEERSGEREQLLRILLYGKDKMIGHAGKISEEEAGELLDLVLMIAEKYS